MKMLIGTGVTVESIDDVLKVVVLRSAILRTAVTYKVFKKPHVLKLIIGALNENRI